MKKLLNRILYVEDEEDIAAVTRLALESVGGFTVKVCFSSEEAIVSLPDFNPDLLLLDVMMPGMDGPTMLEALRKLPEYDNQPVIFMTAKVMKEEIDRYMSLGALEVIAKPFDPMTLADQIRTAWGNYVG